jgi:chemotaxis signal transduction protein
MRSVPESDLNPNLADAQPVRCMYLPLDDFGLLVPSAGVAEIVGLSPLRQSDDLHDWSLGYMSWRGVDIPLVKMERALDRPLPPPGVRSRVAVMHALGDLLSPAFYGIIIQRLPTVVLANERTLVGTLDVDNSDWIDGAVELEVGRGLVPGFEYLEQQLAA